jgi:hypothetical protein
VVLIRAYRTLRKDHIPGEVWVSSHLNLTHKLVRRGFTWVNKKRLLRKLCVSNLGPGRAALRIAEARAPQLGGQRRCAKRRPRTVRRWVRAQRRSQQVPQARRGPLRAVAPERLNGAGRPGSLSETADATNPVTTVYPHRTRKSPENNARDRDHPA